MIYPKAIKKGERICIIDPANAFHEEGIKGAKERLESYGFEVVVSEDMAFKRGTPQERAEKLNAVIRDEQNKGIFCLWGGYGTMTLLDLIDYETLEKNRPVFSGFSDITAMHLAIAKKTDLITYHGPALYSARRPTTKEAFEQFVEMFMMPEKEREFHNLDGTPIEIMRSGTGEGRLIGGNLTIVSRLMGTPYEVDVRGKILFLEEIGEKPYRVHGMLTQLKMAGKLNEAAGIIFGAFTDCDDKDRPGSGLWAIRDVMRDVTVPIVYNVRAGHMKDPLTLPVNGRVKIEGNRVFMIHG